MKRLFDIVFALLFLVLSAPVMAVLAWRVRRFDGGPALYKPRRIGRGGKPFTFLKFRSMIVDADKIPVDTTSTNDPRLTPVGLTMRRYKLDELPQFWNVLMGDMSVVGPRPNVAREVALYTEEEKHLFDVRPGITDLSSIVFSDLEEIVSAHPDPDIAYNQLVRPWKSRLGLFYVARHTVLLDIAIAALTALGIVNKKRALSLVAALLRRMGAPAEMVAVAGRTETLRPTPPPGADFIVLTRNVTAS